MYAPAFSAIRALARFLVVFASSVACWLRSIVRSSARDRRDVARVGATASISTICRITSESSRPVDRILFRKISSSGGGLNPRLSGNVDAGICVAALLISRWITGPSALKSSLFRSGKTV